MFSIGLVLSAGGPKGDPWHSGVLGRLHELTGWDARTADLIVGTSAGSITALTLRSGVSAVDRSVHFRGGPISPEAEAVYARITTPYADDEVGRDWRPMSPKMGVRAVWPPWRPDVARLAVAGLPRGTRSGASIEARMNEMHPGDWTSEPTWIVAVRLDDGRRVVFGRDDVRGDLGQAVRASSAVPGVFTPGRIGRREYIDGGVHSTTNADLTAQLGFDLVVVSSLMTATHDARNWVRDPRRAYFSTKLDAEVAAIRRAGTAVVVVEPDAAGLASLPDDDEDPRKDSCAAGAAALDRALAVPAADGLHELLGRAAAGR